MKLAPVLLLKLPLNVSTGEVCSVIRNGFGEMLEKLHVSVCGIKVPNNEFLFDDEVLKFRVLRKIFRWMDPAKSPVALLIGSDGDTFADTLRLDVRRLCCFYDGAKVEGTERMAKPAGRLIEPTVRRVVM
jgi:hypothetical protein